MIKKIQKMLLTLKGRFGGVNTHEETMLLALMALKKLDEVDKNMTVGEFARHVIVDFIFEINSKE